VQLGFGHQLGFDGTDLCPNALTLEGGVDGVAHGCRTVSHGWHHPREQ